MSGGHVHSPHGAEAIAARNSALHRLDPRTKIVGLIALATVAVTTPVGAWPAYGAYLALLAVLVVVARLPALHVARRMTVEVPFLIAAAMLPLTHPDGVALGGTVALRMTCGVLAMILLSSTTPFPVLLQGFERLRAPRAMVLIVSVMWRYLQVVTDELRRMRIAQESRGFRARWLWQTRALGASVAALFLRSLERGERVHLAMASRGHRGGMPAGVCRPMSLARADLVFALGLAAGLAGIRVGLG
ncbi:MAG TPA: cobalt ECF transporter T component CbiQ [Egibacteraceae bacterium]|nr:cobalt ECF transporter T component CbiQ [Egibacteraceae bacterium]